MSEQPSNTPMLLILDILHDLMVTNHIIPNSGYVESGSFLVSTALVRDEHNKKEDISWPKHLNVNTTHAQ